ncbi:ATPase involved in DNA repair [Dehalobacter sp. DCA]|jgi:RecF/RecN/SMC N terminal domain.|uniref:AAA family ATPase n=1 Tax=Dehalobacter sp. DCA TaxID=1147129 RepID=UPI00028BAD56|nr:AAA family ATPase [Dehalobacter sp. DCA]AFV02385.1 ATPase involved in DNA repair [Dehalobacter sp. DCA]
MIQAEYLRFMQTLSIEGIPGDVRKIANLVLKYLDTLIPLSTAQGQRIKKMVELAQTNWDSICSDIQLTLEQVTEQTCRITQIKSFSVGPFRGFAKQEDFDLASQLVLIYGPNGTGKSSFCEALEYSLLGNVAEAESKRFRNQQDYLKNAHTNSFTPPILIGLDNQENDIPISANEALYRFCFVDKNRIDNFSRIAAQAPAKQTELISTLFGLDAFSEFVRNFTDSMDRYIDLEGAKEKELKLKKQVLAGFQQQLATTVPEELQKLGEDENLLAKEFRADCTFSQMIIELNGNEDKNGLIAQLEEDLQKPIGTKGNLVLSELQTLQQSIDADIRELNTKKQDLANANQQISFKQLYEAVIQVQDNSPEQCPACHTPLSQVTVNPFIHACTELKNLHHLGELQEATKKLNGGISSSLTKLSQIINICCSRFSKNNQLSAFQTTDGKVPTIDWWNSLHQQLSDGFTSWQHLEAQVKYLEDVDKEIACVAEKRTENQKELKRLRVFAEKIVKLQTRRETANNTIMKAKEAIEKFETENTQLITDVETEKSIVAQNQKIANAYTVFVQKLNDYKNSLPAQLVADLGEMVVELYNAFNRHDHQHERLAAIRLPLQQNQRLQISFNNYPNTFFDALHILSEGHIRCIGLAILTAKNIKEDCPFLIFDDPVNAIDDEHRESIRRTMFEDEYFKDKQIILACHGEEFFKDIQNLLSAEKAHQSKTLSFLPKISDFNISVNHNCSPRNYVIAARTHYDKNEIRDSLDKSRKALESLTKEKVWRYVNRHGDGNLSIKMRSVTSPIELRNLTEQLKSKIAKADFLDQNKTAVLTPIETLLGINGESREWRYLNKGTHEEADRAEFDSQTVNEIVTALEQLDVALG